MKIGNVEIKDYLAIGFATIIGAVIAGFIQPLVSLFIVIGWLYFNRKIL
jgi:hypothetical protein